MIRMIKTADICDEFVNEVSIAEPIFKSFGLPYFYGKIRTVQVDDDNVLVRQCLQEPGRGCILVIDGGKTPCRALVGDQLATEALDNGWAGLVIQGLIRDAAEIARLNIGLLACGVTPIKSAKCGKGETDIPLTFAGVTFVPGEFVYADQDGLILVPRCLHSLSSYPHIWTGNWKVS